MPQTSSTGTVGSSSARTWLERRSQTPAILRTFLGDEVGDLGQRLCGGDADARRDADPAMNAFAQLTRERLHFPFAELAQVQKAFIDRVHSTVGTIEPRV